MAFLFYFYSTSEELKNLNFTFYLIFGLDNNVSSESGDPQSHHHLSLLFRFELNFPKLELFTGLSPLTSMTFSRSLQKLLVQTPIF